MTPQLPSAFAPRKGVEYQLRSRNGRVVFTFDTEPQARLRLAEMPGRGLRLYRVMRRESELAA